jgi:hypothetical protein
MSKPKKIKDNPSFVKVTNQIKGIEALYKISPLLKVFSPKISKAFESFPEIKEQSKIFEIPDNFNERFSELGWVAYESMSLEIMKEAIAKYDTEGVKVAEQFLTDSYDADCLKWGILRFQGNQEFRRRIRLIELAKEDYLAKRYHACIPLLLSLLDGIVNDISKHVGFFADSADMTVWDSMAAHETGLQVVASLFTKSRSKTNEEALTIPYRHGILHGRELAFDNKLVAAKVWAALFATKDWADARISEKNSEPEEEKSWRKVLKSFSDTQRQKKLIENWTPRSSENITYLPFVGKAEELPLNTPERAVAEFIENWITRRYGLLSESLVYFVDKHKGKKAGLAKKDFGNHTPSSYKLISIEDRAAAITLVTVELKFEDNNQRISKIVNVSTNYLDSENNVQVRTEDNGQWKIMQNSFTSILYAFHLQ